MRKKTLFGGGFRTRIKRAIKTGAITVVLLTQALPGFAGVFGPEIANNQKRINQILTSEAYENNPSAYDSELAMLIGETAGSMVSKIYELIEQGSFVSAEKDLEIYFDFIKKYTDDDPELKKYGDLLKHKLGEAKKEAEQTAKEQQEERNVAGDKISKVMLAQREGAIEYEGKSYVVHTEKGREMQVAIDKAWATLQDQVKKKGLTLQETSPGRGVKKISKTQWEATVWVQVSH